MDITVVGADGLPDKAYLSIRAGEVRKQVQFKPGVVFDLDSAPKHFVVDVFEKIGSTQVLVSEMTPDDEGKTMQGTVELAGRDESPIKIGMEVKVKDSESPTDRSLKRVSRHQAALEAKNYLDACGVQKVLQGMVHRLLSEQPKDAVDFMMSYLQDLSASGGAVAQPSKEAAAEASSASRAAQQPTPLPRWDDRPGLGSQELDGFPIDGSEGLPDISGHHSVVAAVLKQELALYSRLREVRSSTGVTLAKCIKPGMDHKGHPMVRTVGLVAGDGSSYTAFKDVFDPVIARLHSGRTPGTAQPTDLDPSKVVSLSASAAAKVISVQVQGSRSLAGVRMPTAASLEEYCEVERLLSSAFMSLGGELSGEYHPLHGSCSWVPKPTGMSSDQERELKEGGLLFSEPDSGLMLSAGYGRNWPQARGVFVSGTQNVHVWVNETDHVRIFSRQSGAGIKQAFQNFVEVEKSLAANLKAAGHEFARDEHLGYLNSCPSNLGTAMHVSATMNIPLLSSHGSAFKSRCRALGLQCRRSTAGEGAELWELSCHDRLGHSEVDMVNSVASGCRELCFLEAQLEAGKEPSDVFEMRVPSKSPDLETEATAAEDGEDGYYYYEEEPGLGEEEFPGFPADECPEDQPLLNGFHSIAAVALKKDPAMYAQLRGLKTKLGVSFARCIKTGMDNKGHPLVMTLGAIAGDGECYETFSPLFDPLIETCHPSFDLASGAHSGGPSADGISSESLDPEGGFVQSVKVFAERNLQNLPFLPAADRDQRASAERLITDALLKVPGLTSGEYHPLPGSDTYASKPEGMSEEMYMTLHQAGLEMPVPDSNVVLATGAGKFWPEARGIFKSEDGRVAAFVNQENHLRLMAQASGADVSAAFSRFAEAEKGLRTALGQAGQGFAESSRLGFLTVSPRSLGTAMTVEVLVQLERLDKQRGCKDLFQQCNVTVRSTGRRGSRGDLLFSVSNKDTLGSSEADQANSVIRAVRHFVTLEAKLARGEKVDLSAEPAPLDPQVDAEKVRAWARDTLEQAIDDGRLEGVLKEMREAEEQSSDEVSREQAKACLLQALDDGRLERAITVAIGPEGQPSGDSLEDMDCMKDRAREALSDALQSGQLESVLKNIMGPEGGGLADVPEVPSS